MSMRITRLAEAERFSPAGHEGVGPVRLQGGQTTPTSAFTVALSHYLPGACADLAPQADETVYVVLAGALVVTSDGEQATLDPLDSAHFNEGTVRAVENQTNATASMLVIRALHGTPEVQS